MNINTSEDSVIKTRNINGQNMRLAWNRSEEKRRRQRRPAEKYTQALVANHEGLIPRGTPGCYWEDAIRRPLEEIRWQKFNWIQPVQYEK
jgi:hypothetical protein